MTLTNADREGEQEGGEISVTVAVVIPPLQINISGGCTGRD